jgi:hypothetical protein
MESSQLYSRISETPFYIHETIPLRSILFVRIRLDAVGPGLFCRIRICNFWPDPFPNPNLNLTLQYFRCSLQNLAEKHFQYTIFTEITFQLRKQNCNIFCQYSWTIFHIRELLLNPDQGLLQRSDPDPVKMDRIRQNGAKVGTYSITPHDQYTTLIYCRFLVYLQCCWIRSLHVRCTYKTPKDNVSKTTCRFTKRRLDKNHMTKRRQLQNVKNLILANSFRTYTVYVNMSNEKIVLVCTFSYHVAKYTKKSYITTCLKDTVDCKINR